MGGLRVAKLAGLELLVGDTGGDLEDEEAGQGESGHKRPPEGTRGASECTSETTVTPASHTVPVRAPNGLQTGRTTPQAANDAIPWRRTNSSATPTYICLADRRMVADGASVVMEGSGYRGMVFRTRNSVWFESQSFQSSVSVRSTTTTTALLGRSLGRTYPSLPASGFRLPASGFRLWSPSGASRVVTCSSSTR